MAEELFMLEWLTPDSEPAGETGPWTWDEIMRRLADGGPHNGFIVREASDNTVNQYLAQHAR